MSVKKKILSVDDSPVVRKFIRSTVEEMEYELLEAGDGIQALATLKVHYSNVAVILLDWNMPGMDGFEFLNEVKCHPVFKSIPVMMITTQGEKANIIKAVQAGVSNYLLKPFKSEDLAKKIKDVLGQGVV